MTNNTKELLPCPFCGGNNLEIDSDALREGSEETQLNWIECLDCGGKKTLMLSSDNSEHVIDWSEIHIRKAWNTRRLASMDDGWQRTEELQDDEFLKALENKQSGLQDYNRLMDYARLLSGRLRQMDKRAKAANKRASALQWQLNSLKKRTLSTEEEANDK